MSVNKVLLLGRLGRDPELRQTQSGQAVCNFTLATSERFGGRDGGDVQEKTEWHRIVVWGKQAESCARFLAKGREAFIEGRIQSNTWTDKDGNERETKEVVAQRVQFIGGGGQNQGGQSQGQGGGWKSQGNSGFDKEDIPF